MCPHDGGCCHICDSLTLHICIRPDAGLTTSYSVGGIIVQYPACLCSPFSTLTAIPIFPFYILYPTSTKNTKEPPLNSNSTHIHFHILNSRSIPNPDTIMPSNRAGFFNHNGRDMALAGSLFTCFFSATPSSQGTYYRSLERSFSRRT